MLEFRPFDQDYKSVSDHNGIKGYTGIYLMKAAIEKAGKVDRGPWRSLHGLSVRPPRSRRDHGRDASTTTATSTARASSSR